MSVFTHPQVIPKQSMEHKWRHFLRMLMMLFFGTIKVNGNGGFYPSKRTIML